MRVYRVGHATKTRNIAGAAFPVGPYNGLSFDQITEELERMIWAHSGPGSENHHPAPHRCPVLRSIASAEVCGFESLEALLDWFQRYIRALDDNQFRIWVYDVPDDLVRVGTFGQAVFVAAEATLLETSSVPLADQQLALF
ncbi:hypothetical protein OG301_26670 [Streptomyces platensis]|uniref:hypothetical protein n=1 Tax=Streptomyces platensis TaxID=58346 RepID=UPI002ED33EDD|nr:hypothetical protein OG301_26670 [Streptomyces platensis]